MITVDVLREIGIRDAKGDAEVVVFYSKCGAPVATCRNNSSALKAKKANANATPKVVTGEVATAN